MLARCNLTKILKKKLRVGPSGKRPKQPDPATIAKAQTSRPGAEAPYEYDPSFEVICHLALLAYRGKDVGAILTQTFTENLGGLCATPEFRCACGVDPRSAGVALPWVLTVDESQVTPTDKEAL